MTLETLLALPRNIKKICFLIHDFLMIFIAFWFTQSLKADYSNEWFDPANWQSFLLTALLTIGLFVRMGLYCKAAAAFAQIGSSFCTAAA